MPLDERDETRLRDMLAYARDAVAIIGSLTQQEMEANVTVRLALVRCIEVIGEAGHQVSAPVQASLSTVPWPMMWGMRNRLIHDYGHTDYRIVHRTVIQELPKLVSTLAAFLAQHGHVV